MLRAARPTILAMLLAAVLVAGCTSGNEPPAEGAAVDAAADASDASGPDAAEDSRAPQEEPAEPSPSSSPPTPPPTSEAEPADETSASREPAPPAVVTTVHEREGEIEPFTWVGVGPYAGMGDPFLPFDVPANAVAVRATLHWNGSDLDLAVFDETARCSGFTGIADCNAATLTKAEGDGRHWVTGSSSPAMLAFDADAVRAGCPEGACAWHAMAYAEGDVATTFHLVVEVDTLGAPAT